MMWTQAAFMGYAVGVQISSPYNIPRRRYRVFMLNPQSTPLNVVLPDATTLPKGHGLYAIFNEHASNSLLLKDAGGTTVGTVPPLHGAEVALEDNTTSAGTWRVLAKPFNA